MRKQCRALFIEIDTVPSPQHRAVAVFQRMDSRVGRPTPKTASGDRELLEVVDVKNPHDQPLPLRADPPIKNLEKIVLVVVVVAIIVFASFQINQCVNAYANPATQTSVKNVTRTFPGLMICPFSYGQPAEFIELAPKWSPEAFLAFDFTYTQRVEPQSRSKCPTRSLLKLTNTNVDPVSQSQRSRSTCLPNSDSETSTPELLFGVSEFQVPGTDCGISFEKQVTVKNSAKPQTECKKSRCITGASWTPPNVRCTVLDAPTFDEATKSMFPALKPICNPMREVSPNSVDALYLSFTNFGIGKAHRDLPAPGIYSYSGLIPAPPNTTYGQNQKLSPFINFPSSLSISTSDLNSPGQSEISNMNMSLFGGIVVVLYDSSKGIPKALDFDGARFNTMSNSILGSTVVLSTNCKGSGVPIGPQQPCTQYPDDEKKPKPAPIACVVTSQVDTTFSNVPFPETQNTSFQTVAFQPSLIDQSSLRSVNSLRFDVLIYFSSSQSLVTSPIISLTILTTISIIVSTAATLWGSQQTIRDYVILVIARAKEFLEKRRAAKAATELKFTD